MVDYAAFVGHRLRVRVRGSRIPITGVLLRVEHGVLVLRGTVDGTERRVDADDIAVAYLGRVDR